MACKCDYYDLKLLSFSVTFCDLVPQLDSTVGDKEYSSAAVVVCGAGDGGDGCAESEAVSRERWRDAFCLLTTSYDDDAKRRVKHARARAAPPATVFCNSQEITHYMKLEKFAELRPRECCQLGSQARRRMPRCRG